MATFTLTLRSRNPLTFVCTGGDGLPVDLSTAEDILFILRKSRTLIEVYSMLLRPDLITFTTDGTDGSLDFTPDEEVWSPSNGFFTGWIEALFADDVVERFPETGEHIFVIKGETHG